MAKNTTVVAAGTEDTHDFCLDENGQIMMLSGLDAYAQIVNCNMRTILGEKQLDMASGLPYLQTIFADKSTIPIWVAEVQKMLENISFVKRVVTIDTSVEDGVLSYRSVIETDLGPLTQTGRVEAKTIRDKRLQRVEEEEAPAAYILSFNTGDGTPIAPMAVNPGTAVKLPTAVKEGHDFVGWYLDQAFANPVTSFVMPEESVTLYARFESFSKFVIDTSLGGNVFNLSLWAYTNAHQRLLVDWGDGTYDVKQCSLKRGDSRNPTDAGTIFSHTYPRSGKYTIKIDGWCAQFKVGGERESSFLDPNSKSCVIEATAWGDHIVSAFRSFSNCENLTTITSDWGTLLTNCDAAFEGCTSLRNVVDWSSIITDIRFAYTNCINLEGSIPELPALATICNDTFNGCVKLSPTPRLEDETDETYASRIMPSRFTAKSNYVSGCSDEVRSLYTSAWGGTKTEAQSLDLED